MTHVIDPEVRTARNKNTLRFRLAIMECYFRRHMTANEIAFLTGQSHHAITKIVQAEMDNISEARALCEVPTELWKSDKMDLQELLEMVCKSFHEDPVKMKGKCPNNRSKPAFCCIATELGYKRREFGPVIGVYRTRQISHQIERSEDYMGMDRFYAFNFPLLLAKAKAWKSSKTPQP